MRISIKRQLATKLAFAVGATALQAILVTTSVANQVHVRHRSATAESPAGHGSRGGWNNLNSGYAGDSTTFRSHTHHYPNPFRGECALDDGPFPCDSDP